MRTMGKWVQRDVRVRRVVTIGLVLLCAAVLQGGTVFMKNGYLVQGPVTELTPELVVISWPYGEVTIHRRFYESVQLTPEEEKQLEERRKQASAPSVPEDVPELNITLGDPMELFSGAKQSPGTDVPVPQDPTVEVLPIVELGERQELFPSLRGSLPQGWILRMEDGVWVAEGPPDERTGNRPRIAGTVVDGRLSRRVQIALAKEEVERSFSGWRVVDEGLREVGLHEGYEICGRGEHGGVEFHVRQILAWVGDGAWIFSCAWQGESEVARVIEWCVQTFEFTVADTSP